MPGERSCGCAASRRRADPLKGGVMFERQAAADQRASPVANQLEGAVERANTFIHASQSPAIGLLGREADAIVGNLDGDILASNRCADAQFARLRVPEYIGDALLYDTIGRLRQQAVDVVETGIDVGCEPDVGALRLRIAKQGADASRGPQALP